MATTTSKPPCARALKIQHNAALAKDAFANHVLVPRLNCGLFRSWRCQTPREGAYWFDVVTGPGWLMVRGDVGELIVQRCDDMIAWSRGSIESIDYFAEKVPHEIETEEYDADVAREYLAEELSECEREILEATDDADCKAYRKRHTAIIDLQECGYIDEEHRFVQEAYDSDIFDGGDFPRFTNYTSSFLWCRECVKWLLAHLPPDPEHDWNI